MRALSPDARRGGGADGLTIVDPHGNAAVACGPLPVGVPARRAGRRGRRAGRAAWPNLAFVAPVPAAGRRAVRSSTPARAPMLPTPARRARSRCARPMGACSPRAASRAWPSTRPSRALQAALVEVVAAGVDPGDGPRGLARCHGRRAGGSRAGIPGAPRGRSPRTRACTWRAGGSGSGRPGRGRSIELVDVAAAERRRESRRRLDPGRAAGLQRRPEGAPAGAARRTLRGGRLATGPRRARARRQPGGGHRRVRGVVPRLPARQPRPGGVPRRALRQRLRQRGRERLRRRLRPAAHARPTTTRTSRSGA